LTSKIKTSILIDIALWRKIKLEATIEGGFKGVNKFVESALKEELSELGVAKTCCIKRSWTLASLNQSDRKLSLKVDRL
jgi:hypothetical protein